MYQTSRGEQRKGLTPSAPVVRRGDPGVSPPGSRRLRAAGLRALGFILAVALALLLPRCTRAVAAKPADAAAEQLRVEKLPPPSFYLTSADKTPIHLEPRTLELGSSSLHAWPGSSGCGRIFTAQLPDQLLAIAQGATDGLLTTEPPQGPFKRVPPKPLGELLSGEWFASGRLIAMCSRNEKVASLAVRAPVLVDPPAEPVSFSTGPAQPGASGSWLYTLPPDTAAVHEVRAEDGTQIRGCDEKSAGPCWSTKLGFAFLPLRPAATLPLYNGKPTLVDLLALPGPALLYIHAHGQPAGDIWPQLGIRIDGRELGTLTVDSLAPRWYCIPVNLPESPAEWQLQLLNDYLDVRRGFNVDVFVEEMEVQYPPLLEIRNETATEPARLSVSLTSSPGRSALYRSRASQAIQFLERHASSDDALLAGRVVVDGETRDAWVVPATSEGRVELSPGPARTVRLGFSTVGVAQSALEVRVRVRGDDTREELDLRADPYRWTSVSLDLPEVAARSGAALEIQVFPGDLLRGSSLALLAIHVEEVAPVPVARRPPSVYVILLDACRADRIEVLGGPRGLTPNLSAFADTAILFRRAYSQVSWTLPSITTLFTGLYPSHHGVRDSVAARAVLDYTTLATYFAEAGYHTAAFSRSPYLLPEVARLDTGFERYRFLHAQDDDSWSEAAEWIEQHRDVPRFVFLHILDPHAPYVTHPEAEISRIQSKTADGIDGTYATIDRLRSERHAFESPPLQALRKLYDGEVAYQDMSFGGFLARLEEHGLEEDAWIIVTSDHGESFGEHGNLEHSNSLYLEEIHVPLIVRPPRLVARPTVSESVVGLVDVLPSLLAALGLRPRADLDGVDVFSDPGAEHHPDPGLRSEFSQEGALKWIGRRLMFAVTSRELVHQFERVVGARVAERADREVYDFETDPGETHNLVHEQPDLSRLLDCLVESDVDASQQATSGFNIPAQLQEQFRALGYVR